VQCDVAEAHGTDACELRSGAAQSWQRAPGGERHRGPKHTLRRTANGGARRRGTKSLSAGINPTRGGLARLAWRSLIQPLSKFITTTPLANIQREKHMTTAIMRLSANRRHFAALTALTACVLVGTTATTHAATPSNPPTIKVAYADLNLESAPGAQALYARIVSAARQVCGSRDVDIRDLGALARAQTCESGAIAKAVQDVHSPALAALFDARVRHG
jgi:UrcA family protein